MRQLFGCILIDRYLTPGVLSPAEFSGVLSPAEFSGKIRKFLRSLAAVTISLTHMLPAQL